MPIDFSLILNSRGRPQLLKNLLRSAYGNAYNPQRIEFLIRLDEDDSASVDAFKRVHNFYPNVQVFVETEKFFNSASSINKLATFARGNYLFCLNDDVCFLTPKWDKIVVEAATDFLANFRDNILYVAVGDTSVDKGGDKKYASFPIITKEAYNSLGYFINEQFVGLGGDVHLYRVFNYIGRVLHLHDVVLDHIYHNTIAKVLNPDQTAKSWRTNSWSNPVDGFQIDITKDMNNLLMSMTNAK